MGPGYDIPIVATLSEALPRHPDTLLIGLAGQRRDLFLRERVRNG